jgi:hypothetical protein
MRNPEEYDYVGCKNAHLKCFFLQRPLDGLEIRIDSELPLV